MLDVRCWMSDDWSTVTDFSKYSILETERLSLVPLTKDILEEVYHIRTLPSTTKFIGENANVWNETKEEYYQRIIEGPEKGSAIQWIIQLDGKVIGSICLWNFLKKPGQAEVGYDSHPDFQGNGYLTEALQKVIKVGFGEFGLEEIIAFTHEDNRPSRALLERCGFECQGKDDDPNFPNDMVYLLKAD